MRIKLPLLLLANSIVLVNAREQQIFSVEDLNEPQIQRITPYHHQPRTMLFSKSIRDSSCIVLKDPEPAQIHRSITKREDVIVVNKTLSTMDEKDGVRDHTFEIIGFDEDILWTKLIELCDSIEYGDMSDITASAEYEVVRSLRRLVSRPCLEEVAILRRSSKSNRFFRDVR
jgi:hypothetical protein